jgi:uncharacterized protein (TIGR00645 family)
MTEAQRRRPGSVFERLLEQGLFGARWLMAPFYVGLVAALALLLIVFVRELIEGAPAAIESPEQAILLVLSLIDLSLAGNLVLIVTLSGYENFVSKIDTEGHVDRPSWMGAIDFSGMKLKLIASIVAISAISLLRAFMQLADAGDGAHGAPDPATLAWMVGLHVTFLVSGVLFALMDWLAEKAARGHGVDRG